ASAGGLLGRGRGAGGAAERVGQHAGGPFGGGGPGAAGGVPEVGHVRGHGREEDVRDVRGEPGGQSAGRVQGGGVGGRVADGDDGVEAGGGDVVGVGIVGAVGRVVVGREHQPGADRVAGVVDGEDG